MQERGRCEMAKQQNRKTALIKKQNIIEKKLYEVIERAVQNGGMQNTGSTETCK